MEKKENREEDIELPALAGDGCQLAAGDGTDGEGGRTVAGYHQAV